MTNSTLSWTRSLISGSALCALGASMTLAQSGSDSQAPSTLAGPGVTVAGGETTFIPISTRDDLPRMPDPGLVIAHDWGDERVSADGGDPYFLGFTSGSYYPPEGQRLDPLLAQLQSSFLSDGRPSAETYGFVMFSGRIDAVAVAALENQGARVLGYHPSNCLKVAFSPETARAISALPGVRWVGSPRTWQKVHPVLTREVQALTRVSEDTTVEIFVSLYDSDLCSESIAQVIGEASILDPGDTREGPESSLPLQWRSRGWQEAAIILAGADDPIYIEPALAFRTRAHPDAIQRLAELDFVAFIEFATKSSPTHDKAMPLTNADKGRVSFHGGATGSIVLGESDWGMDAGHQGLNHAYGWGWNLGPGTGGPWSDPCGHGSHVAGTILGNGNVACGHKGAAPGSAAVAWRRFFNVRVGGNTCGPVSIDLAAVLNRFENSVFDGTYTTPKPHVINHSWGSSTGGPFYGSEFDARLLDNSIYFGGQLHIFAAGNNGSGGQSLNLQPSAKNVLAVGSVALRKSGSIMPGDVWTSSSRGPTADLRWGPQVCAPGAGIYSVAAGTGNGYSFKSGTSMAAPQVAGIAAQLCDRHSFLRYNSATLSAVLMAGSITTDSTLLTSPSTSSTNHLNQYGAGRVDAYKSAIGNSQQALYFWGFGQDGAGYTQLDFTVGSGATQLTVVMSYAEIAASAGASSALVNDLDMYLDRAPFTAGGNTGEYSAQQSSRDPQEIRIVPNPQVGGWRIKIYPDNVPSGSFQTSKVGVCVIVTYGDVTPNLSVDLTTPDAYVQPGDTVEFDAAVFNPSYIASAVYLTLGLNTIAAATGVLEDGCGVDFQVGGAAGGREALLGNIRHGKTRTAHWETSWPSEGLRQIVLSTATDNAGAYSDQVNIYVDGTGPSGPSNFTSTTHTTGFNCASFVNTTWSPATDGLSGLDGYRMTVDHSATSVPNGPLNLSSNATNYSTTLPVSGTAWYFHLRALDRSGNWGTTQHIGPFLIYSGSPFTYCTGSPNSVGSGSSISSDGSHSIAANNLLLLANSLPANKPCLFFYGPDAISTPFGNGMRCVGGAVFRLPVISTGLGVAAFQVDYGSLSSAGQITAGSTWKFQNWYRDPAAGGAGFNLSDALSVTFCP